MTEPDGVYLVQRNGVRTDELAWCSRRQGAGRGVPGGEVRGGGRGVTEETMEEDDSIPKCLARM
jgi:hypothetical protein